MNPIMIGRLLRSNTGGCVVGCKVSQLDSPAFGEMLRIPLAGAAQVFGLVYDIHIDDDGLVRQLVTAEGVSEEIIEDNRNNRNMPVEISVVFVGWEQNGMVFHSRVPRPPLTLDAIYRCSPLEFTRFVSSGNFGYLRMLLNNLEIPAADLVAAHLRQVKDILPGDSAERLVDDVIIQLKDDYPRLMDLLGAISGTL